MTGETPFSLAYRYEAMVPVELGVDSLISDNFDPEENMILQVTRNFGARHINNAQLNTSTRM